MSGSTTELNLKTAVDADDTADYLTLSLADSLRTVDGLFNNVTGHSHAGAHQGGPLGAGSIGGSAIADGAITSAKIADGTIVAADIAAGSITQIVSVAINNAPTTTSTTPVDIPGLSVTLTIDANSRLIAWFATTISFTGPTGNLVSVALNLDSTTDFAQQAVMPYAANYQNAVSCIYDFGALAGGSHTVKVRWSVSAASITASITQLGNLVVMEAKK